MSAQVRPGCKLTEVGVIPEDWDVQQIIDTCGFIVPGRNKPNVFDGNIPWITTPDLTDGGSVSESRLGLRVSESEAKNIGSKIVPAGSILMSCVGELGLVAYAENDIVINQQLHAFIPSACIDGRFLSYAIKTRVDYLYTIATKTALPYLNKDNCNSIKIPFPRLQEQRAIAAALSDMDALISGLDQLIAKKRDIKQAAMQQLLTGQQRLPGFSGKWETKTIGQITECVSGGTPNTLTPAYWGGDVRWMSSGELNLKVVSEVDGRITNIGLENSSTKIIPAFCVLVGLAGQGKTRGTVAKNVVELCTNQSIAAILPSPLFSTDYLYYNLDSRYDELRSLSTGDGGRGGLNLSIIRSLTVPFPTLIEQIAIANILSDMDSELTTLETRRDKARQLKQGMMQELLTGRIRLL